MNKKILITSVIVFFAVSVIMVNILLTVFFILSAKSNDMMGKKEIMKFVTENQKIIETAVSDFLTQNIDSDSDVSGVLDILKCNGIKNIHFRKNSDYYRINDERMEFYCGGYGMGSETGYEGFLYSLSATIAEKDEQTGEIDLSFLGYYNIGADDRMMKFFPDGDGWRWNEVDGDNTVYIEHIVGDFYYYFEEY